MSRRSEERLRHLGKVAWLVLHTQERVPTMALFMGVTADVFSMTLTELRRESRKIPYASTMAQRGHASMRDMPENPVLDEIAPVTDETVARTHKQRFKSERTRFAAPDQARRQAFDAQAHYDARHYRGSFEL